MKRFQQLASFVGVAVWLCGRLASQSAAITAAIIAIPGIAEVMAGDEHLIGLTTRSRNRIPDLTDPIEKPSKSLAYLVS